jgi:hypothetical protein
VKDAERCENVRMIKHVHINHYEVPDVLQITAAGWDGQIFRMSRQAYFDWHEGTEQWGGASAVYVLYADHFDKADGKHLYVGRTADPIRRGKQHELAKSEWTAALFFTSMGDWMSATHVEAIEAHFIQWVNRASRYEVTNGTEGAADPRAGKADQLLIDVYLDPIRDITQMAGIDVFSLNLRGVFTLKEKARWRRGQEINCLLRIVDGALGRFEVLADSSLHVYLEREGKTPTPVRDQVDL